MSLMELIQAAKLSNGKAFGKTEEKRALMIVRAVLGEANKQIHNAKAGEKVALPGFGTFFVKEQAREKDGKKIISRRVVLRQAVAKPGKAIKEVRKAAE